MAGLHNVCKNVQVPFAQLEVRHPPKQSTPNCTAIQVLCYNLKVK